MLFNEPKLLKCCAAGQQTLDHCGFSALQRAEIAEIERYADLARRNARVSVLFNEPKLLKSGVHARALARTRRFSALQRAEIAEIIV